MCNIVRNKGIIRDLAGMELGLHKCKLLVSSGAVTQQLRDKAAGDGIKIVTEEPAAAGERRCRCPHGQRPAW